jgi:autotransporter-associated beta strand protein
MVFQGLGLAFALCSVGLPAAATTRVWLGVTANWSNPNNWSPFGVPQNGDSLTFPDVSPVGEDSMVNDLANLTVNTMTFTAGGYALNGNALTLSQGITDNHSSGAINIVRCDIQFSSGTGRLNLLDVRQLEISGTITLANNQDLIITASITNLTLSGSIQGNGSLVKRGDGALFLRGSAPNTYTGPTRVEGGALHLAKTSAARAISANVTIDGALYRSGVLNEIPFLADDLAGQYPPDLSMLITNTGDWHLTNGATVTNLFLDDGFVLGSGLLNLECDVTTRDGCEMFCSLNLGNQSRTFTVKFARISEYLEIHGNILGPLGPNLSGIIKMGTGALYLKNQNTYLGPTLVRDGAVIVQHGGALGSAGAGGETRLQGGDLAFDGGTFNLSEPIIVESGLSGIYFAGNITLTGTLTLNSINSYLFGERAIDRLEISGAIGGFGELIYHNGTLRLSGSSPNTFGGGMEVTPDLVAPSDTVLELAKPDGVLAVPGEVLIKGGGTNTAVVRNFQNGGVEDVLLYGGGFWYLNGQIAAPRRLRFFGPGTVDTGSGQLQFTASAASPAIEVASGSGVSQVFGRLAFLAPTNDLAISSVSTFAIHAQVSGAATIRQLRDTPLESGGTLTLDGDNQFTGPFIVEAGQLQIKSATALGTTAAGTFVNNNASIALDGGIQVNDEPLTLDSTNAVALTSLGPVTNTWSGPIALQRTVGLNVPDALGALTHVGLSGISISGPGGFTKTGPGALFNGGSAGGNTYIGPTTITDGLLEATRRPGRSLSDNIIVAGANATLRTGRISPFQQLSAPTVLPIGAGVTVRNGALWAMNGTNFETLSRLDGDGRLTVSTGGALTVSNVISCEFSGAVSGSGLLNKRGFATFQVTSPYSYNYTGAATVFDGTYKVDGDYRSNSVTVKLGALLRGGGTLGDVTVEPGGVVKVDPRWSGVSGGVLGMNSVNFQPSGGVLGLDFFGPDPTGGNDSLGVNGSVALGNLNLSAGFLYPPREGDVVTLITKASAGAVSGTISGFPEGSVQMIGNIPVVTSYVGGDGNDVTLTVTNLPLRGGGAQFVSSSSGNVLVPDDCGQLRLVVTNRSPTTVTNLRGTLRSLTDGVVVTIAESAFPNLAPNARGTNLTPFQIRTVPGFSCGAGAEFELVLMASNAPPIAIVYTFVGTPGYSLQFDGNDDQVEVPANTFSGVVNNFTIELWANPTADRTPSPETNAGVSVLLSRPNQRFAVFPDRGNVAYGPSHVSAGLSIGGNGISAFEQGSNSLSHTLHLPSRLVYTNALSGWTHVALVYASRAPSLYVNGALVRSGSASLFGNVHPSGSLGGSTQADYGNFEGQLDEVRVWNTALSQPQIQSNMTHRLTGAESGLVAYFRCDEGGGSLLSDSAPASPNPSGALMNGVAFVLANSAPITPPDADCLSRGGACESCFVVTGAFMTNTPMLSAPLDASGSPSLCSPPKLCPGAFALPLLVPFIQHTFANTSGTQVCVTAQLHFACPASPHSGLHAAAYLGVVDTNNPCLNYLGDSGGDATAPFSFSVHAGSNLVILVTQRAIDVGCDHYTLELFGLPCPPPTLRIARDVIPGNVLLQWSSAYPDFRLQAVNSLDGPSPHPFNDVLSAPVLLNGKYSVTNAPALPQRYYRLRWP